MQKKQNKINYIEKKKKQKNSHLFLFNLSCRIFRFCIFFVLTFYLLTLFFSSISFGLFKKKKNFKIVKFLFIPLPVSVSTWTPCTHISISFSHPVKIRGEILGTFVLRMDERTDSISDQLYQTPADVRLIILLFFVTPYPLLPSWNRDLTSILQPPIPPRLD